MELKRNKMIKQKQKLDLHTQEHGNVLVTSPDAAALDVMVKRLVAAECHTDHVLNFLYSHASFNHSGCRAEWWPRLSDGDRHFAWLPWQNVPTGPYVIDAALDPEAVVCKVTKALQSVLATFSYRFLQGDNGLPAVCRKGYAGLPVKALTVSYPHSGWDRQDWSDRLKAVHDRASEKWKADTLWVGRRLYGKLASSWGCEKEERCFPIEDMTVTCVPQLRQDEGYFFPSHAVDVRAMASDLVAIELHGSLLTLDIYYAFVFTSPSIFAHLRPKSL